MSIKDAVDLVIKSMVLAEGGEIFVLKMPTLRIKDLIEVITEEFCPKIGKDPNDITLKVIGPRIGEKMNEILISEIEYDLCRELDDMYVIAPNESNLGEEVPKGCLKLDTISTEHSNLLTKTEIKEILIELNLI
jgi:FlaA1/EpsC-like NDP-sugar epimerase